MNRKHPEAMLRLRKSINSCNNIFVMNFLCPYYRFLWGKCKDLQRKNLINQIFFIGAVATIEVGESGPPIRILHKND